MKKKTFHRLQKLYSVRLYLDDVLEIIGRIESLRPKTLTFSNKKYEFDTFEELKKNSGEKIKDLGINAHSDVGYLSLDISRYSVTLYTDGKSQDVVSIWLLLRDFLKERSKWYSPFLNTMFWYVIFFCFMILGTPFFGSRNKFLDAIYYPYLFALCIVSLFFIFSLFHRWKGSIIYLNRSYEVSNFWDRNRDRIIFLIIGAVLSILGQIVIRYLSKDK